MCNQLGKEVLGHGMSIADFYLGFATLFIYFPSALLILLYATIFTKLKSQKIAGQGATLCERQRAKRNRNALNIAGVIVFALIVCQLPSTVIVLLSLHSANLLPCTFLIHSQIVVLACFAHSAVNLCICLALSGNNREGLKKVLKCFSFQPDAEREKTHLCS